MKNTLNRMISVLLLIALCITLMPVNAFADDEDPHVHEYTAVVVAPTCTDQGYTTHTCSCGDAFNDSYVDPLGHDYSLARTVEPTCTEQGYSVYRCSRCGDEYCDDFTPTVAHDPQPVS